MNIPAVPIAHFMDGKRQVAITTREGVVSEGDRQAAYRAGSVVIADGQSHTIAGPISRETARELAAEILNGNSRAVTQPQSVILLAAAVIAFTNPNAESEAMAKARRKPPSKRRAI